MKRRRTSLMATLIAVGYSLPPSISMQTLDFVIGRMRAAIELR
jgi:hypothetical protein